MKQNRTTTFWANILFAFCLPVWLAMPVFAQQYSAVTYGVDEGLGASKVYTFYHDSRGYLWVSTAAGISRFDGKTFKNYTTKDGLTSYQISSIHEDSKGQLWFKSLQWDNSRLFTFNGRKFTPADSMRVFGAGSIYFHRDQTEPLWVENKQQQVNMIHPNNRFTLLNSAQLKDNYIYDVWMKDSVNAYLATQLGLLLYQNGTYTNLSKQVRNTMQVYQIVRFKDAWWLQTDEGIWQFNGKRFDNSLIPPELQKNITQIMLPDNNGNLWFGTVMGLYRYDGDCFKRFTTADGMITNRIANMMADDQNNLWIISENGLMVYKDNRFINLDNETAGFMGPGKGFRLRHIMQDRQGNVWITTQNGIARYSGFAFLNYRYGAELQGKEATAILSDSKNRLWIGYQDDGITLCQNNNCRQFTTKNGLPSNSVYNFLEDRQGNIWIADGGLTKFDGNRFTPVAFDKNPLNKFIGLLQQDQKGNIWIASNNGLYRYNGQQFTYYELTDPANNNLNPMYGFNPYNNINSLAIDPKTDSVWVAATSGVYVLNPKSGSFRLAGGTRYFGTVKQMRHDQLGNLWMIRTEGGLLRFDGKQVMQFDERDGLSSSNLQSLSISNNYAWLGTPNGIDRFDIAFFNQTRQTRVLHLGKPDGFISPECTGLSYTDAKGNLWQGTNSGITKYNPYVTPPAPNNLLLHITDIKLRYETIDWIAYADSLNPLTQLPENLRLQYNENTLTFSFDALFFLNPKLIHYQYRLAGTDTVWLPAPPEQVVTYANLPPGYYRFEVRAQHLQNPGAYAQTAFSFIILPPVWHYWWFWAWLALGAVAAIAVYMGIRFMATQLYRRRMLRRALQKIHEPK
ncbi:hypothetical protein C7N43_02985 [Sphingobacteriales bacterium UPWRP_1]|nr:hypothetical protein BVG80_09490 [Sphingobacteriales bacterium TSM_CSM]PSJ78583.1 hypothetical protein C7N43_02985 [Sphingobacteriales bacterium UPWRP_1]